MACNFNCTVLFSPYLKGSTVTSNVLTLIQKQINNEMFFTACLWLHSIWHKKSCIYRLTVSNFLFSFSLFFFYLGVFHLLFSCCNESRVCLHGSLCSLLAVINIRLQGAHYESSWFVFELQHVQISSARGNQTQTAIHRFIQCIHNCYSSWRWGS